MGAEGNCDLGTEQIAEEQELGMCERPVEAWSAWVNQQRGLGAEAAPEAKPNPFSDI